MLDFFRTLDFWMVFVPAVAAAGIGGALWSTKRRSRQILRALLLAVPAFVVWIAYRSGIPAAAVTAVTGIVVAALARDAYAVEPVEHAVVADYFSEVTDSEEPPRDFKLAS